jgi:hypothetical protein
MKMNTVKIVWNNCDSYVELNDAESRGYEVKGDKLIGRTETSTAFDVVPCSIDEVPVDEDGEKVFEGFFLTESGKVYKDAE